MITHDPFADKYGNPTVDTPTIVCPECGGDGYVPEDDSDDVWNVCCPTCDGNGFVAA